MYNKDDILWYLRINNRSPCTGRPLSATDLVPDRTLAEYLRRKRRENIEHFRGPREHFELRIHTMVDHRIIVKASSSDSIHAVKQRLAKSEQIPVESQRLVFRGKPLRDEKTLREYGINGQEPLFLAKRSYGGGSCSNRLIIGANKAVVQLTTELTVK